MRLERFNRAVKLVYGDPKFRAQMDWYRDHGIVAQLQHQGFPNPEPQVTLTIEDPPDFDWWEPRYDQPFRREQARERELNERSR